MSYYPHEIRVLADELVGQWVLSSGDGVAPRGWGVSTHGRWTLACSKPLESLAVRDTTGRTIGWVIGHAVTEAGVLIRPGALPVLPTDADLGNFVDHLNGRFVFVDLRRTDPVLYPDGLATLACVYSGIEGTVASTSGLIPRSVETPFLIDRILAVDAPYRSAMYPLGLTPRNGVYRVLPNHVLDCASWTLMRRWPVGPIDRTADPPAMIDRVASAVRGTLTGLSEVHPLHMTLTGGRDSRMILGCAREMATSMTLFTADLGDESSWRDVTIARRIAARHGLVHRVTRARASARELRTWVARTGGETGEVRGWRGTRALAWQPAGRATITGAVADLSKVDWWRIHAVERPITIESMLRRCNVGRRPEFVERMTAWLGALPRLDSLAVADVFHMEQTKGCWAGVIEYGELGESSARLCPMTRRDIIDGSVRLPVDYRLKKQLHQDVLSQYWPELLDFPYEEQLPVPAATARVFALRGRIGAVLGPYRHRLRRRWTRFKAARAAN